MTDQRLIEAMRLIGASSPDELRDSINADVRNRSNGTLSDITLEDPDTLLEAAREAAEGVSRGASPMEIVRDGLPYLDEFCPATGRYAQMKPSETPEERARYEKARANAAGLFGECADPHPTAPLGANLWCRRPQGHDGQHNPIPGAPW